MNTSVYYSKEEYETMVQKMKESEFIANQDISLHPNRFWYSNEVYVGITMFEKILRKYYDEFNYDMLVKLYQKKLSNIKKYDFTELRKNKIPIESIKANPVKIETIDYTGKMNAIWKYIQCIYSDWYKVQVHNRCGAFADCECNEYLKYHHSDWNFTNKLKGIFHLYFMSCKDFKLNEQLDLTDNKIYVKIENGKMVFIQKRFLVPKWVLENIDEIIFLYLSDFKKILKNQNDSCMEMNLEELDTRFRKYEAMLKYQENIYNKVKELNIKLHGINNENNFIGLIGQNHILEDDDLLEDSFDYYNLTSIFLKIEEYIKNNFLENEFGFKIPEFKKEELFQTIKKEKIDFSNLIFGEKDFFLHDSWWGKNLKNLENKCKKEKK